MPQTDFIYASAEGSGLRLAVSIFADRLHLRDQIREDVEAAGLAVRESAPVASLIEGAARPLGEVVLLDCPRVDGSTLAALSRLDARVARSGAHFVISTTVTALEDVFACCDQSAPQILVDPTRAERVLALGRVLAHVPSLRFRELSETDRLALLRLTEQVGEIAHRLERIDGSPALIRGDERAGNRAGDEAFRFESPAPRWMGAPRSDGAARSIRTPRPPLPDPRLVRRIIRQRQLRGRFFDGELFADPAWDILLDLTVARAEHARVSVTSLCIASGVPPTTALRWIGQMTEAGLLERVQDESDRRRAFITLSDRAAGAIARYFEEIREDATQLV